jgi:DUF4097 and DUF4098 domain-containing protein YvlB
MLLFSALVALLSLSSPSFPVVAWHKNFSFTGRPEIRVNSNNVDCRIYGSDGRDIVAVVYTDGKISSDAVSVTDRQSGNRLELEVRVPNQSAAFFTQRSVILELRIPMDSDVDAHSGQGSVMIRDVQGNVAVHTDDGNIQTRGITGILDLESEHGDLQVDGTITTLNLYTRAGNIAALVGLRSKMRSPWVLRTGEGDIDLRLSEDFSADLDVHTGAGNVRLDFPLTMQGGGHQSSVRAPINGGGQHLEIHSDRGNIMVKKTAGSA